MEIVATVFTTTQVSDIVFIDKSREEKSSNTEKETHL